MGENGNKWTPEPWCAVRDPSHFHSLSSVIGGGGNGMPYSVAEFTGQTLDEQQANTARAVACVNACAGMADPAAEIERLRAEVAQWKANHDNQVHIKQAILDRRDLGDRAKRVQQLMSDAATLAREVEAWRTDDEHQSFVGHTDELHHARHATDASGALARCREVTP